ncbi:hypothetical protein FOA43_001304 [Brettanomyces nanus]|uniref:Protein phosphatase n=1 Tax=Eeniella nana TaxID=13502 RepID=A0A875RTY0_EENNA|nr:uncharacterized protein FOA43_001304 [Brettanomyces nanus]QPG73987.1 hypothetical protein FOA43_001304 [Brettanomyces nanus]
MFTVPGECFRPAVLKLLFQTSPRPFLSATYRAQILTVRRLNNPRSISTSGSFHESFSKFRNFHNGDQFTKQFIDTAAQYTVSVAYNPKDRHESGAHVQTQNGSDAETEADSEPGEFVSNFKKIVRNRSNVTDAMHSPTGEDNYVVAYSDQGMLLGVLDGVGGWAEQGYDSSAISRELASIITQLYLQNPSLTAAQILDRAYAQVKLDGKVDVGSTTVVFGIVDAKTLQLDAVNLGDSWFGIFRKQPNGRYRCFYQSKEQTYYFNAPYQLSIIPPRILKEAERKGTKFLMNVPADADKYGVKLLPGDVVLFTTDGMVDNVGPEDLEIYLDDTLNGKDSVSSLGQINKNLVSKVVVLGKDPQFNSIFSQRLSRLASQPYIGGKPDDVTSVIMAITEE